MVGAWGFEPQTPNRVKVVLYGGPTLLKSTSTKFPGENSHRMHCINCFNCMFSTFLCAKVYAHLYSNVQKDLQNIFIVHSLALC